MYENTLESHSDCLFFQGRAQKFSKIVKVDIEVSMLFWTGNVNWSASKVTFKVISIFQTVHNLKTKQVS